MPAVLTFNSLQEDVRRYLERGTSVDAEVFTQIPRLITMAEREITTALKIQGFISNVVSTLLAGVSVYQKPDRWRTTVSMNFGIDPVPVARPVQNTRVPLYTRSYEYLREYWPDSSAVDQPEFYADYNYTHWLIVPTPVIDYPWEINYYAMPPLLDTGNQTNWLSDYAPTTLLYRVLLEATPFLKNDERIPVWQSMYDRSLSSLNGQDLQKIIDRAATRQGA